MSSQLRAPTDKILVRDRRLSLDPVLVAISELLPSVQEIQPLNNTGPSRAVVDFLRHASLKDVLPVHVHSPRKFQVRRSPVAWKAANNGVDAC